MAEHSGGSRRQGAEEGLTRKQVADRLGVSIATVRRLEESGELVPRRVGEREERRFDSHAVEALAQTRASAAGGEAEGPPESRAQVGARKLPWGDLFCSLANGARVADLLIDYDLTPAELESVIEWFVRLHRMETALADRLANEERLAERLSRLECGVSFLLEQYGFQLPPLRF